MAGFAYVAVDAAGCTVRGHIEASHTDAVRKQLEQRQMLVLEIREGKETPKSAPRRGQSRLSAKALALSTRQLATLVSVTPLEEAMRTLVAQADRPNVKQALEGVHTALLEGRGLAEAMATQGSAFPPLYRAMVKAGEASGALQSILERLADGLERDQEIRGKVIAAVVYPCVLAVVATGVVIALMTFVVPKVVEQFDSMGQALPLLTRAIIGLSRAMTQWGWLAALLSIVALVALGVARRREIFRLKTDAMILRLPMIGSLVRDLHAAQMARTLATMIAAGLPVLEGLNITARTVSNRALRQATEAMAEAVREGGGLSSAMKRAGVFPPVLIHMTASGESSGRLEPMLARAADYLDREFANFTSVMLSLLEPVIIVVMGGVVALIVLSILLPILQINTLAMG
ncbi:type II secretion system inner membrane protein GspF [Brevundimonas terrae]|uniref:General secretion pathway protein F n=1 Tax=Brevundimonas terrae TaxID=363631 RepID=A0ABP3IDZ0_9CAUL|nr:type II secretion system inner membrane protein GspF [Brevundimonas terrae]NIJ27433.1 general secretion pathway protein F [Brevundimonas terrae]